MEEENKKLYMPSNIQSEIEFLKGITKKESKYLIYMLVASLIISFIIGVFIKKWQIGILAFLFLAMMSYLLVAKTSYDNFSFLKNIILLLKYYNGQNFFQYKYNDFWRNIENAEKEKNG